MHLLFAFVLYDWNFLMRDSQLAFDESKEEFGKINKVFLNFFFEMKEF